MHLKSATVWYRTLSRNSQRQVLEFCGLSKDNRIFELLALSSSNSPDINMSHTQGEH